MLYILLGIALGAFLCFSFVKEYLEMRKNTNSYLANGKDYVKTDHSLLQRIISIIGVFIGLFAAVYSSGYFGAELKDDLTVALGLALILMFIGQYLASIYHSSYWMNESAMITAGKLLRFKSIKSIKAKQSLWVSSYTVTTYHGDEVAVPKKIAVALSEKCGKSITR